MNSKQDRIAALARLIKQYQDAYYNGEAEVSDAEFDALWDELAALDPENGILKKAGADGVDGFPKARHLMPMGSQGKAANPEEFRAWAAGLGAASWVVQYKLDGASLELQYKNGVLERAVTRGNGSAGDEITVNARRMRGVTAKLNETFSGGVRGEVVMTHDIWKKKYQNKANCRNAANGIMRRKDGAGCEDLDLIVYDAAASGNDAWFSGEMEKIAWLKKQGFRTVESREFTGVEEIIAYRAAVAEKRKDLPWDIDGLVVKDSITDMADLRRVRPERQIAFKFELETAVSVLRAVEWSESGATYTPIGIVDPVRLAGTTVQRANLNHPDMIRAMGLKTGSRVVVVKRGEIIPKIEGLAPPGGTGEEAADGESLAEIRLPQRCGTCGTALVDGGTRLYCPNPECPKRLLHRLEKWVSVLDIRELGEKLIRQLFERGRVRRIHELYTLTAAELADFERMGEVSAAKVVRYIRTKRELSLVTFVTAFDIEGVAELLMEKIVDAGFNTLEKLRAAPVEDLAAVFRMGEITSRTLYEGLKETKSDMDAVLAAGHISIAAPAHPAELPLKGFSFCFTGELSTMKRNEAEEKIRSLGGSAKTSVVKGLSFLVTNDTASGSAKNLKAQSLGVTILGEAEFLALLKDGPAATPVTATPAMATVQNELF
ncbi:MAG: NAD-dependent DNA ligase LigA [Spirochaetaceae bacterium]|jgi:DNA ligase (NAD+)|nr:NAD-dependent DNA ligase LigA [Spirochaetaceae bacterium]